METAIIPFESESNAGAFLPVSAGVGEPPRALEDGQETTGERPRRERKAPDMEEFDITTGSRVRKQLKTPPVMDADAEDLPDLPQQSAEREQDILQAADADLPAPAADLDAAIRQFMLGEGPQLGVNDIQRLDDAAVSGLVAQIHPAFLVNLDAVPEELASAGLLVPAVYEQYKDLTLPLHRYIADRVIVEWFGRLRPSTKSNYLGAIHRIFGGMAPAAALVLPYDEIAAKVDAIIQSSVDSGNMHNPHGCLTVYQGGLARLVAIQLGIPSEQRPVAELTAKHKNDTLAAIEHKCNAGGSSWKLMVQKWKGFVAPSKRVAAVQKGAQTKLITVAELKQVQAIAMISPIRQLDAILLSMAGLSFLMSRGNRSELLPHLKFFEAESPSQAPAAPTPSQVAVPGVKEKVKIQLSISFGSCRACVDLWKLWEEERPKLESLSKCNDVIIGPVMQKRRLEAVACTIMRLGEERSGVADGIDALQSIWQELDALERSLGGPCLALFVDVLENIINCTKPETLMSNLKGQGRTKVTKQDLKTILDRHWQLTSAWPSVSYADDSEDLHVPKRFKT